MGFQFVLSALADPFSRSDKSLTSVTRPPRAQPGVARRPEWGGAPAAVFVTGKDMDNACDRDVQLAHAMTEFVHVLWVDPPQRHPVAADTNIDRVSPRLSRIRPSAPRSSRRRLVERSIERAILRAAAETGTRTRVIVLTDPMGRFPGSVPGHRLFYVTEDWVSGASTSHRSRRAVRASIEVDCARADTVAATNETLADRLHLYSKSMHAVRVIPTGCAPADLPTEPPVDMPDSVHVALAGPLDDRLDYDVLDAVIDAGHDILALGRPATETDAGSARLARFLGRPGVVHRAEGRGHSPRRYLPFMSVGIAPARDDAFTRASSPTRTLEYLAAGLPVVSTDTSSTPSANRAHVTIARSSSEFVAAVSEAVSAPPDSSARAARIEFAAEHSWSARAALTLRLAGVFLDTNAIPCETQA